VALPTTTTPRLRRDTDPPGHWVDEEFREGFADDPELPEAQRRRIAGWARVLTPDALSEEQAALLQVTPPRGRTPARERAERLGGVEGSPFWQLLADEPRARVLASPYPLTVGQLSALVGVDADRLRYWTTIGLLPARRRPNGYREYFAEAAARALALEAMSQPYITALRDLTRPQASTPLLAGIAAVLHEQSASAQGAERDLLEQAAQSLARLVARRAQDADAGSADRSRETVA
jgi:DNA-binding transcriptional MerR regulator